MASPRLTSRAMGYLSKTLERMLTDEKRAARVAKAVGAYQKGRERLDRAQDNLLRAMNFATRADYRDVGKRISALKRRVRHLAEHLEKQAPG
jgi:hypothetical protein